VAEARVTSWWIEFAGHRARNIERFITSACPVEGHDKVSDGAFRLATPFRYPDGSHTDLLRKDSGTLCDGFELSDKRQTVALIGPLTLGALSLPHWSASHRGRWASCVRFCDAHLQLRRSKKKRSVCEDQMPGETFTPLLKISVEFGFCDFAGQIGDKPVGAFDPCFAAVSGKERMACHFVKN
jgi:hypothetical protein